MTKQEKKELTAAIAKFAKSDPDGFASALINTIDTYSETVLDENEFPRSEYGRFSQATREEWALGFVLAHRND